MNTAMLLATTLLFAGPQADVTQTSAAGADGAAGSLVLSNCRVALIDEVEVPSKLPGVLAFQEVREGDQVEQGQEMARLDDRQARLQLAISKLEAENDIDLQYAAKEAEVTAAEHDRALAINKRIENGVPEEEVRRRRLTAERSALLIEKANRDLKLAELKRDIDQTTLDDHRITSPIDGIVVDVYKHAGEAVTAGEPVLRIVNIDRLRIEGYIQAAETWEVNRGQLVEFRLPGRPEVFHGKVVFVDPSVVRSTGEYRVWAEVENQEALLRPGMKGALKILSGQEPTAAADEPRPSDL